jgi:hydroxyacylglutathione hydrolase
MSAGSPATERRCPLPTNARSPFVAEIEQVRLDMGGFEVNSYVVHAPEGDLIVDAGAEPKKILAAATQLVTAILLTHGHRDHVGALEHVRRETGAPVYAHLADAEGAGVTNYEPLRDGEDLVMAGMTIKVLHTPGHSPGSVTFVLGRDQIVGDLILPGSVGRTDISGASWEELEVSVRKVMPLWEDTTRLFAGHGDVLNAMEELENNPYLPLGVL